MPFHPLNGILHSLEQHQDGWRSRRQFKALVLCWPQVVGAAVAAQTRPLALQRGVLMVATSSAAWAQNLAFERPHLLQKLRQRLDGIIHPEELVDIRFSTAQWASGQSNPRVDLADSAVVWRNHPSYVLPPAASAPAIAPSSSPRPTEPMTAFQQWAARVQARSQHLPLCPQCQCPTPQGELERWSVCGLCAPKRWTQSAPNAEPPFFQP